MRLHTVTIVFFITVHTKRAHKLLETHFREQLAMHSGQYKKESAFASHHQGTKLLSKRRMESNGKVRRSEVLSGLRGATRTGLAVRTNARLFAVILEQSVCALQFPVAASERLLERLDSARGPDSLALYTQRII